MKTANVRFKQGLFCAALLCLTLAASAGAQVTGFSTYCDLRLTGCPQDYDTKALTVPLDVVSLSTKVRACGRQDAEELLEGPAVMFIIDHSTSMANAGGGAGNDANGNRFRVTRALIDSIYARTPDAQVGMVIFANGLVFKAERDANLVDFTGVIDDSGGVKKSQAFLPLMQLNQPAKTGGTNPFTTTANPNGIDVFRSMFAVRGTGNNAVGSIPNLPEVNGTDITIAFEAALQAFKATNKSKDNQYIIFLSDGEPIIGGTAVNPSQRCNVTNGVPGPGGNPPNPRCTMLLDFEKGELNGTKFPTTYTVYLRNNPNEAVPPSISRMTENVKNNGYSATNAQSNAWALTSNFSDLLTLMMDEIVSKMFKNSDAKAKKIFISSAGVKDTSGEIGGEFNFKRQLPIDTAAVTNVTMSINYDVRIDSKTPDGRDTSWIVTDSLFTYEFTVRRSANPGANWNKDEDGEVFLDEECKTRVLDLQYDGATLVGKEIKDYMGKLDIVFTDESNPGSVKIDVSNALGETLDLETFTLSVKNGKWAYQFQREISASASAGDGKLQHAGQDSIILVYRNPAVPLDTIRVAVPFSSNSMVFYDKDGKQLPDPDTVKAGYPLDIYANILDEFGDLDADMIKSGKVAWTIDGGPTRVALVSDTGTGANHSLFRTETAGGSYLITATYTNGPMKIEKTIKIVVVPGDPKYIEAVTDSAKINYGQVKDTNYLKNDKEYEFSNGVVQTTFYAVIRDAYGNFISMASGADWSVDQPEALISADPRGDLSYAIISRQGSKSSDFLYVIVSKKDVPEADTVHIVIAGVKSAAVGPNPFVPGSSPILDRLRLLDYTGRLEALYRPILENSKSGGGNGNADNANGILVVAEAHRSVKSSGEGNNGVLYATAKAVIYDAVGHIVFESKFGDIILAVPEGKKEGSTFGFVWNGKNKAGRTVGPGTYVMRMSATLTNGERYSVQQMIGVTTLIK